MTGDHQNGATNGPIPPSRAKEAEDLLTAVQELLTNFIKAADDDTTTSATQSQALKIPPTKNGSVLIREQHPPHHLQSLLTSSSLPAQGLGRTGFLSLVQKIYHYSINTWSQGFLDKLYATTTPVGLAADLVLSSLNTNVHVYQVSPALTVLEKQTARALAGMFGFQGPNAGGVSQPGGSAANQSSMVIARNVLFPETKTEGYGARKFVLFTSAHGHYSVEKAAQMFGFGSNAVRAVAVDEKGRMMPSALEAAISNSRARGETPFYVNATAGTTVLGSFDPFEEISEVARREGLWLHVDASWGGPVVFSDKQRYKLRGVERADSISICPHKMLNVPLTCSFLLGKDLREFHKGMTLPAGYLFHNADDVENGIADKEGPSEVPIDSGHEMRQEYWDLADLTPQCGRRGDSLKLALSWIYYGTNGFRDYIDHAFSIAAELAGLVDSNSNFTLVSEKPPPCLQVCFYYNKQSGEGAAERNSVTTERISRALIPRGFMTDYAPGDQGKFFRVVVNGQTRRETVQGLVEAIVQVGSELGV